MKFLNKILTITTIAFLFQTTLIAQGLHFSQFYNAPMLLNPANTALMSDNDFRTGLNYREQWASVPVPYKTLSAFADFQAFRQDDIGSNWMGFGLAFFNDKSGDGMLSLLNVQTSIAYHIQMGEISMFSAGLYGGYTQRSVDYNKLTFDLQWDGFGFNTDFENGEQLNIIKTNYLDVGAGINYAYFPNEFVYFKLGAGVAHVNTPSESFYSINNKIGIRPMVNADAIFVANERFTINPSAYYSSQRGAYEFLFGSQFLFSMVGNNSNNNNPAELILGGFYRWDEAAIGVVGLRFSGIKATFSYDYTISKLKPYNNGRGAAEFSLIYMGNYGKGRRDYRSASCPRF